MLGDQLPQVPRQHLPLEAACGVGGRWGGAGHAPILAAAAGGAGRATPERGCGQRGKEPGPVRPSGSERACAYARSLRRPDSLSVRGREPPGSGARSNRVQRSPHRGQRRSGQKVTALREFGVHRARVEQSDVSSDVTRPATESSVPTPCPRPRPDPARPIRRSSATSASSPTSTTASRPWPTGCSSSPASSTSAPPGRSTSTGWTSSASAGSRSRARPSGCRGRCRPRTPRAPSRAPTCST